MLKYNDNSIGTTVVTESKTAHSCHTAGQWYSPTRLPRRVLIWSDTLFTETLPTKFNNQKPPGFYKLLELSAIYQVQKCYILTTLNSR